MSRWIVALPLIAVGVSFSDGRAATVVPAAEPVATPSTLAQRQPAPASKRLPKSAATTRHRHHFTQHSRPPARDPVSDPVAKAPPAFPPPVSAADAVLKPRSVYTISVPAPAEAPGTQISALDAARTEAARTEAALDSNLGRSLDADNAPANLLVLADKYLTGKYDKYNDAAITPMAQNAPAPVPLTAIELLMLFGACGCAAIGFYGLVALNGQRRARQAGRSPSLRRAQARPPSPNRERYADRVETQRLFPHQFGAAIRSR
jgi:hypothetical protein